MSERSTIKVERHEAQRQRMAPLVGSVACGGCPLLRIGCCPGKAGNMDPCPPKVRSSLEVPTSYHDALMDDSCDTVIAQLRPRSIPESVAAPVKSMWKPPMSVYHPVMQRPPVSHPVPQRQSPVSHAVRERLPSRRYGYVRSQGLGAAVADLIKLLVTPDQPRAIDSKK